MYSLPIISYPCTLSAMHNPAPAPAFSPHTELDTLIRMVEQSPVSAFILNPAGKIEHANPHFSRATGYTPAELTGKNIFSFLSHQTSQQTLRQIAETLSAGSTWHGELLTRKKDGGIFHSVTSLSPVRTGTNSATHYVAISAAQQFEHFLLFQRNLAHGLAEASTLDAAARLCVEYCLQATLWDCGAMFVPDSGAAIYAHGHSTAFTQNMPDETRGGLCMEAAHSGKTLCLDHAALKASALPWLKREALGTLVLAPILHHDRVIAVISLASKSEKQISTSKREIIESTAMQVANALARIQAQEELQKAHQQLNIQLELVNSLKDMLKEQAMRDHLTGLHNRRYLDETLPREIIRASRENASVSVLLCDIDCFKRVNDKHGHAAGDAVLQAIAALFAHSARGSDITCRFGGEEFLQILPGMPVERALERAEHLRKTCAETVFRYMDEEIHVTLSFGVAAYPQHGKEAGELLMRADKALYLSKQAGRNRVSLCPQASPAASLPAPEEAHNQRHTANNQRGRPKIARHRRA